MPAGKAIETRNHIIGFKEEISKAASKSEDEFFTWFNESKDKNAAFVRGYWDFSYHIVRPAWNYISLPEEKTALEIGYGGGRILAAASHYFNKVIGIDIHDNSKLVEDEFRQRGILNCKLICTDGSSIPVDSETVDFGYSFIVLQHVEKYEIFLNYLKETYRILKPGGIAVLYFGRKSYFSLGKNSTILLLADIVLETILLSRGYKEFPARVNETNLVISILHAKRLSKSLGFKILNSMISRRKVPDGIGNFGGQYGLALMRG
jgi:ubiquinone/menaquinone biosynthesis C-methylase UbiE